MKWNLVRVLEVVLLFSLVLGILGVKPVTQIVSAQSGTNLALGKPAQASSSQNVGKLATYATDGTTSTAWSSTFSDPAWIYVDLGTPQVINQVVLIWEAAYGRDYRIEGSNDLATWTSLAVVEDGIGGTDYITVGGTWRYVRMYGIRRGTGWGFSLLEYQVFDVAQSVPVKYPIPPAPPPRQTGNTLFSDDFNDSNIADWQVISGNWDALTGAMATNSSCNTGPYHIVNGNENWGNYQISLDFRRVNGWDYGGILLHYSAAGFYRVDINPSVPYGGWVRLYKSPNTELKGRPWPFVNNHWDHLIIDIEGPTIEIYVLDANQTPELLLSYTDPDPILNGKIGFATATGAICPNQVQYDNVKVKSIIPSYKVSGEIIDTNGNPIPQVDLSINTLGITTFTNSAGEYSLQRIPYGAYTLSVSKPDYKFSPEFQMVSGGPDLSSVNFTGTVKQWTLMYYLAGDDLTLNSSYGRIINQLENAAGNPYVDIVVVWDKLGPFGTQYYHVQNDANLSKMATYVEGISTWKMGELNMGDPTTLVDFVNWSKQRFPSTHYALILDDHGSGLKGAMYDLSSLGDHLTLDDLSTGFKGITDGWKKLDVLVMNACLMGMLEDAYQFKNYINYYVASENIQGTFDRGYNNTIHGITESTTPLELGNLFVQGYANEIQSVTDSNYTMSVADISKIDNLVQSINDMAGAIEVNMSVNIHGVEQVLDQVQRFDNLEPRGIDNSDTYIDLYDFARLINEHFQDANIQQKAQLVMDGVLAYTPPNYERHRAEGSVSHSHGVSIFFPVNRSSFYNVGNYDFAVGAIWNPEIIPQRSAASNDIPEVLWGSFLVDYFNLTSPTGLDDPNPPPLVDKPQLFLLGLPLIR